VIIFSCAFPLLEKQKTGVVLPDHVPVNDKITQCTSSGDY